MSDVVDIMVDIETLSKYPDGVILSIAIVPFKMTGANSLHELTSKGLYLKLDVKDQLQQGRKTHKGTIEWWKTQSEKAKEILKPSDDDLKLKEAADQIDHYIQSIPGFNVKKSSFWARGIQFDHPFLADMYRMLERDLPWNEWNLNCTKMMIRTLTLEPFARYNLEGGIPSEFVAHNALYDAALEVMKVQELTHKFYG